MKRVYCIHEDRESAEIGVRFAVASLMKRCPTAELVVFRPNPTPAFAKWVAQYPRVRLDANVLAGAAGWDCKPHALLSLLEAGADEAIWVDSDILVSRDPSPLFEARPIDELIATEEPPSHPGQGSIPRTAGWGLPIGRSFPITFNSSVVRATKAHVPLLNRWRDLLNDPRYKNAQAGPIADRPVQFLSDQDVLTALLGSAEFSSVPVRYLKIGREIIHCGGALGYTVARRLTGLFRRTPPFLHAISGKPWSILSDEYGLSHGRMFAFYRRLLQETSPYVAAARSMRAEVDAPTPWLDYHSPLGRILRVLGCGHFALQGLPLTIAANGIELAKAIVPRSQPVKIRATSTPDKISRVLNIAAGNLFGGIETLLVTLAQRQSECKDVHFGFTVCFEGRLADQLRIAGAPVLSLGEVRFSRPWTVWRARRRLKKILQTESWDAVICHGCWPHVLAAPVVRRNQDPLVFWGHGIESGDSWLARLARRHPPDLVLANSKATQQSISRNLFSSAATELLYLPVSRPELTDVARIRESVRAALGATSETVAIVLACRLEAWKGHELLLQALAKIKDVPHWTCWVIGGPQRPAEEAYLADLLRQVNQFGIADRVQFLGQRTDVPQLFASADIHCQPNRDPEPFGIAFIEALYAGLPVVTMATGGALEIVDATCGILVPSGDIDGLAAALEQLISDPLRRHQLSLGGPQRAIQLCDVKDRMSQLADFLHAISESSMNSARGDQSNEGLLDPAGKMKR